MTKQLLLSLLLITSYPANANMRTIEVPESEIKCFADNLYHESRGEPLKGIVLVGETVINRMEDRRWPSTACGVIYQRKQFSWTANNSATIYNEREYKLLYDLSYIMLSQRLIEEPQPVNHYLRCDWRDKVSWWKSMEFYGSVGNHCFYKG